MSGDVTEVGPVDPALADALEVAHAHNCMGQDVFIYYLAGAVTDSLLQALRPWGEVVYPLGEHRGVVKLDASGAFMLSCLIGSREMRITLRHAAPPGTRARFEVDLARATEMGND